MTATTAQRTIPAGTAVRVRTTNGGDAEGILYSDYRPTFGVSIYLTDVEDRFTVHAGRVASVNVVGGGLG